MRLWKFFTAFVLVLLVTVPVQAFSTKGGCKNVTFDRNSWGFNSAPHRARILTGKAQSKSGRIGNTFKDEYSGKVLSLNTLSKSGNKISNAHVDHVVPLKYMHDNGGCKWSPERKKSFANDPKNLKLISARDNTSKGSKSPSKWLPDTKRAQAKYLKHWQEVMNKYSSSKLKIKVFKFENPQLVKYAKTAGKFGRVGVRFIPSVGAVATLVIAADTVIIISEDPDKYFEDLATDFNTIKKTSFKWGSASWDNSKEWSLKSWEDTSNWIADRNIKSFKWTTKIWDTTKKSVDKLTDNSLKQLNNYTKEYTGQENWIPIQNATKIWNTTKKSIDKLTSDSLNKYNDGIKKLTNYIKEYINQENWDAVQNATNELADDLIDNSSNLYNNSVKKLGEYVKDFQKP